MEKIETARGLLIEQLRDIYNAEKQLKQKLSDFYNSATDPQLKRVVETYIQLNEDQEMRLKQVFSELFIYGSGETCEAMHTMVKMFDHRAKRSGDTSILNAAVINTLQHIIHYKIAGYNGICSYAKMLRLWHIAEVMYNNLEEERRSDNVLSSLAEDVINPKTMLTPKACLA